MSFQNVATRLPQLGSKRVCVSCTARFYDTSRVPPVCPKCGAVQPPEAVRVRAPVREPRRSFRTPAPAAVEAEESAVALVDTDAEDEAEADEDEDDEDEVADIIPDVDHNP